MNPSKSILCVLFICLSSASGLFGQLLVFDYSERSTWIGDGVTFKQNVVGKWIVCLCSNRFIRIEVYPARKTFYVYDDIETFFTVNGANGKSHTILGYASGENLEANTFINFHMLMGADKVSPIGGGYGNYVFPTSMTGPLFFTYPDPPNRNEVSQGTHSLKFNSKETRFYNNSGIELENAADNQIAKYRAAGNVLVN
jgi:hypothetical protein